MYYTKIMQRINLLFHKGNNTPYLHWAKLCPGSEWPPRAIKGKNPFSPCWPYNTFMWSLFWVWVWFWVGVGGELLTQKRATEHNV